MTKTKREVIPQRAGKDYRHAQDTFYIETERDYEAAA